MNIGIDLIMRKSKLQMMDQIQQLQVYGFRVEKVFDSKITFRDITGLGGWSIDWEGTDLEKELYSFLFNLIRPAISRSDIARRRIILEQAEIYCGFKITIDQSGSQPKYSYATKNK